MEIFLTIIMIDFLVSKVKYLRKFSTCYLAGQLKKAHIRQK